MANPKYTFAFRAATLVSGIIILLFWGIILAGCQTGLQNVFVAKVSSPQLPSVKLRVGYLGACLEGGACAGTAFKQPQEVADGLNLSGAQPLVTAALVLQRSIIMNWPPLLAAILFAIDIIFIGILLVTRNKPVTERQIGWDRKRLLWFRISSTVALVSFTLTLLTSVIASLATNAVHWSPTTILGASIKFTSGAIMQVFLWIVTTAMLFLCYGIWVIYKGDRLANPTPEDPYKMTLEDRFKNQSAGAMGMTQPGMMPRPGMPPSAMPVPPGMPLPGMARPGMPVPGMPVSGPGMPVPGMLMR